MGRAPCCSKVGLHRGPWTPREDNLLINYIQTHGEGHWRSLPKNAGLLRCGKSCRLRWMNYLRPDIKRGNITPDEDDLIIRLHSLLGNRWSLIAGRLPGRTDNEIKNYWNTHLSKRLKTRGTDPNTHKKTNQPRKKKKNRKNMKQVVESSSQGKPTIKAHQPKPIRVSSCSIPRNDSFESNNTSSGSSTQKNYQQGYKSNFVTEVVRVSNWFGDEEGDIDHNRNGIRFLVGDHQEDHDLVNGSDYFECTQMPKDGNSLDKLYEEYFQLLKSEENHVELDSFAESLLI